jgi:ubiquitin-protein ligase
LEKKLFSVKNIEKQLQKIFQEFRYELIPENLTKLRVHLLTYGFNEYHMDIDLHTYPDPPIVELDPDLAEIIKVPVSELMSIKEWEKNNSEPIEVVREISWLVDKNSRIDFEIELLKEHYKKIEYKPLEDILKVEMRGKMKTENLTFDFEVKIPRDYPMSVPQIDVLNEFDIESQTKIKNDLQASFQDFFDEWTPYSYLIDLFNLIAKKIFEVSVISCVICHKIECPTCSLKIAGGEEQTCFIECPHCERSYHKHCWEQTIKNFGKCGFCLKPPPPNMS